ncbi:hypothetical protein G7046_g977 [Stylonectria norvegica]|nr:hypothetical protein G7046_g977 [Stylonectria norvegica]
MHVRGLCAALLTACLAGVATAGTGFSAGDEMKIPKNIDPDVHIEFTACREWNVSSTCRTRQLDHARCYDFDILDHYLDDNVESVGVLNGRCVIWEHNGCHGDHTAMIMGKDIPPDMLCAGYKWSQWGSSVKCCAGDSDAFWCADPGYEPHCTT